MKRGWSSCAVAVVAAAVLAPRAQACTQDLDERVTAFLPNQFQLPTNGRVVLDVHSFIMEDDFLAFSVDDHHPRLRAGAELVSLHAVAKESRGQQTIVVLAAEHPLRPSTSYALVFDPPLRGAKASVWKTGTAADEEAPRWLARPTADAPVERGVGCGRQPAYFVDINVAVAETVMIRVDARERSDKHARRELYLPDDTRIAFRVFPGYDTAHYFLKLTAIDMAGNESKAPGPPIEVVVPAREVAKRK